jgi:hypothetical protein
MNRMMIISMQTTFIYSGVMMQPLLGGKVYNLLATWTSVYSLCHSKNALLEKLFPGGVEPSRLKHRHPLEFAVNCFSMLSILLPLPSVPLTSLSQKSPTFTMNRNICKLRVLLIGSGGREHALAWKLSQSVSVEHVFVFPGNGGTVQAEKISNVVDEGVIAERDYSGLVTLALKLDIGLVVVGPDSAVVDGIERHFRESMHAA